MEVTSAVHSVGFLKQLERLNTTNGPLFLTTKNTAPKNTLLHCYLHPNHSSTKNNGSRTRNSKSVIIKSTSSSSAASIETSGSLSEVEKIKQKCLKWKWKGEYSINYFVSSDSSDSNHPPLLLVHGFGASIPHWRRYVFFPHIFFLNSHPLIFFA